MKTGCPSTWLRIDEKSVLLIVHARRSPATIVYLDACSCDFLMYASWIYLTDLTHEFPDVVRSLADLNDDAIVSENLDLWLS